MDQRSVRRPIQRSIVLGSMLLVVVLSVVLSLIAYLVLSSAQYLRYDTKLRDVITFVEDNADADDLAICIQTGQRSKHYDELQSIMNDMVDDFELEYLYIVIPGQDIMVNVISATSATERAAGEADMPLLETTDAYSAEELERYLSYWDADDVGYFKESSGYGEYYTACKPLRDSSGNAIALICADLSLEALNVSLATLFGGSIVVVLVVLGLFGVLGTYWIRKNITLPLLELENSAREFASKSHDAQGLEQVTFNSPDIDTGNEVEALAVAVAKMADDIHVHAGQTRAAQMRATDAERDNVRLAEAAESAAKIAELSQSVTSLLTNMPGLSFSKDADTGVYLACNQAFAEYAHKSDPSGVVGLTDHEIFDPVTAQHFVDDDVKALSMDEPYVFFEDVFDAAGNPKQFKTTKMKFFDTNGRLCTLGMCVDVTDLMSARRDTIEARRAYEQARDESITYYSIARALSADYLRLYYVDLDTNSFTTYHHDADQETLLMDQQGDDFFDTRREEIRAYVYADDQIALRDTFTKENILRSVDETGAFTISYRLMVDGEPTYMALKASRIEGDEHHLVVGVSNVDAQMKHQEASKRMQEERATIARVTALSGDYLAIYTVDPETNNYKEYSIDEKVRDAVSLRGGSDFFEDAQLKCEEFADKDDLGMIRSLFVKERVLSEAGSGGVFVMTFRLLIHGIPTYVSLRAALVEERDGPQLIVGISDVDSQVKRDREFAIAQNRANRDALTGVKNKHAYADAEAALDQRIQAGEDFRFGIVVCDLNDLKVANDTKGHQAGDDLLKQACSIICTVFKHSPVFRVGGDEFAVILEGYDYERVDELIAELERANNEHTETGDAIIAWGVSTYAEGDSVASVFKRADDSMYENKRSLKGV